MKNVKFGRLQSYIYLIGQALAINWMILVNYVSQV